MVAAHADDGDLIRSGAGDECLGAVGQQRDIGRAAQTGSERVSTAACLCVQDGDRVAHAFGDDGDIGIGGEPGDPRRATHMQNRDGLRLSRSRMSDGVIAGVGDESAGARRVHVDEVGLLAHGKGRGHGVALRVDHGNGIAGGIHDIDLVLGRICRDAGGLRADSDVLDLVQREHVDHADIVAAGIGDVRVFAKTWRQVRGRRASGDAGAARAEARTEDRSRDLLPGLVDCGHRAFSAERARGRAGA